MLRRKPAKHHTASTVKVRKSDIMARRETKSIFSDMMLNANLGIRIGAPQLRMSRAVRDRRMDSWSSGRVNACIRMTK
jgi:hypothetical protein